MKPFFLHAQKVRQKSKYLEKEKSFWYEVKSIFLIFEGLSLKQIKQIFLEGENPTLKYWNRPKFAMIVT